MLLYDEARDEMLAQFKTVWDSDAPVVNGGVIPTVFYDGIGEDGEKPTDAAWARIQIRHNLGEINGVGGPAGERRRTTKRGTVTVQIFTPLSQGLGLILNEELTKVAKSAFEGVATPGRVIFRDVRPNEIGVSDAWYQTNVLADFEYDEFI